MRRRVPKVVLVAAVCVCAALTGSWIYYAYGGHFVLPGHRHIFRGRPQGEPSFH